MKKFYFVTLLIVAAFCSQAQVVVTIHGSNVTNPFYVQSGALVYIQGGISIDNGGTAGPTNSYIQNNGTIELVAGPTANSSGFSNNETGLITYTTGQTTGTFIFAANSQTQSVSGTGTAEFMNVTTNNTLSPTLNLQQNTTIDGVFTLGGATCNINTNTLTLSGTFASSGTLTGSSTSNLSITGSGNLGSALSFASGAQTLNSFTLNRTNSSGQTILLGSPLTVPGTLTITGGILNLQGNNLNILSTTTLAGSPYSTGNMIQADGAGQFIRGLSTGAATYVFPVGDGTPNYSPVSLAFSANSAAGTLGLNVVNSTEPNMNNPSAPAAYLTRYWTFGNNTLANYTFTGTFQYPGTNVVGTESNIQLSSWGGSAWTAYYGSSASSGTITLSEAQSQTTAPLLGDFTGREATPAAYAVTGGTNCGSTTVGVASSQDGISYQLYLNNVSLGSPVVSSATGTPITFGAQTGAGSYTVIGTDGSGNTTQMTGSAVVNFIPTVNSVSSQSLCSGIQTTEVDFSGTGTTYTWTNSNTAIGLAATGAGNIDAFTSANTGSSNILGNISVTPNTAFCTGTPTGFSITVLPTPTITVSPTDAICTGSSSATLTASCSNYCTGVTYTWAPSTDLSTTTGNTVVAQISLLTFYTVTGTGGNGCTANSAPVPVATVPSGGNVTPTSVVICSGGTTTLSASGTAGHDYQWQVSTNNVYWTDIAGATNTGYTTKAVDGSTKKYYRIVAESNACWDLSSTTSIVDISVTPTPVITAVTSTTVTVSWAPFGSGQYNISWTGTAGSGSANALTTSIYTISSLTPNGNLSITVTPVSPTCAGVSPATVGTQTLCGVPGSVTASAALAPAKAFKVTWGAVSGATAYRVYYRNLLTSSSWSFADTTGTQKTVVVPYGGATYAVYVAAKDCPLTGDIGDGSTVTYVTTNTIPACSPIPTVTASSGCPNQIAITITGGSGSYALSLREISPNLTAGASYNISGSSFSITVGTQYAGSVWEIYARNLCSPGVYSAVSDIVIVTVKPGCPTLSNLVASHITCHGFTLSWNTDNCGGLGVSSYQVLVKGNGALNYNGYSFAGTTDHAVINWLNENNTYDVEIRSITCNGATSAVTTPDTVATSSCRDEEPVQDVALNSTGNDKEAVAVYPNPSDGRFFIDIGRTDMSEATVKIELVNQLGQVIQTNINTISGGHLNQLVTTPSGIASDIYFVRTTVGDNVYVSRIMIAGE